MPTVKDEDGVEHEIVQIEAVATIASLGDFSTLPASSAKMIEQAMATAVSRAYEDGVTKPDEIRARMMTAREAVKKYILAREAEE